MTCGIESPVTDQQGSKEAYVDLYDNVECTHSGDQPRYRTEVTLTDPPKAKANWKKETAADPACPKQWCITAV